MKCCTGVAVFPLSSCVWFGWGEASKDIWGSSFVHTLRRMFTTNAYLSRCQRVKRNKQLSHIYWCQNVSDIFLAVACGTGFRKFEFSAIIEIQLTRFCGIRYKYLLWIVAQSTPFYRRVMNWQAMPPLATDYWLCTVWARGAGWKDSGLASDCNEWNYWLTEGQVSTLESPPVIGAVLNAALFN
jgi:hypothetical protein